VGIDVKLFIEDVSSEGSTGKEADNSYDPLYSRHTPDNAFKRL